MSFQLTLEEVNQVFDTLRQSYRIYAPKRLKNAGRYCNTDLIRYQEIRSMEEIEWEQRSDYSPKEVFYPINQTLFHFTEHYFLESQADEKDLLIFARSCDIHGIKRLDKIFLENGPQPDSYYKRMRDKVHFILMECPENGWESCACCSMGTNVTDEYDLAMRPLKDEGRVLVECRSEQLARLFSAFEHAEFQPKFVRENKTTIQVPDIREDMVDSIRTLDMWKEPLYRLRCLQFCLHHLFLLQHGGYALYGKRKERRTPPDMDRLYER